MKRWTWPEKSVRSYESLWILTQRFLWLNAISFRTLGLEIGLPDGGGLDLITLDQADVRVRRIRNRLIQLLHLTRSQTRHAMVKFDLLIEKGHLRFCPLCLRLGYHSAIFQVQSVSHCPIHRCTLAQNCAQCGVEFPLSLERYSAFYPFACPECRRSLAESRVLVSPPSIKDFSSIRKIWRITTELPRIEWKGMTSTEGQALAKLTSVMLADRFKKMGNETVHFHISRSVSTGNHHGNVGESCYLLTTREQRSVALYKSYRRYLQRQIFGAKNFAKTLINRLDDGRSVLIWFRIEPEATAEAYAFGLFRYSVEYRGFEGIRSVHARRATWVNPVTRRKCLPDGDIMPKLTGLKRLRCSERDRQWIEDHALALALQCIFADCLEQGNKMKQDGRLELWGLHSKAREYDAAAVAFFNDAGDLEFWSHQFHEGEDSSPPQEPMRWSI
jgi:hypothetical protein